MNNDHPPSSAVLRIKMLGRFQTWHQHESLNWPTQKSKALFQILLIEPGRLVPTDKLLECLWPDFPLVKAKNNLWVTISQVRRVLQPDLAPRSPSTYILKQAEGYLFNPETNYWLDVNAFAMHLITAQSARNLNDRITALEKARILYQGDYLEDEPYAEWAQFPRAQWRRRYDQLLNNLAEAYLHNGSLQKAMTHCHEILAMDNTNETALRLLMRCHASLGERATSLKVFDEAVQVLREELGVDPMPETAELAHQIKISEEEWKVEQAWAINSPRSRITQPFVGRTEEVDLLTQLLTQTSAGRGQTALITGEPGIGKSRLAEVASTLVRRDGYQLLSVHCHEVDQSIPYQPLIEMARQVMAHDDHWQQLAPAWLRELAILVPEMGAPAAAATVVLPRSDELDERQQGRLFQAIYHLFAHQAEQSKLALVVEDIHWADPTTLNCLHYLSCHITRVPIALIITLREESLSTDADLAALLNSLQRELHVARLHLAGLTEIDIISLLAQTTDTAPFVDWLGSWLYQETEGNPFFFVSLLQSFREKGLLENASKTDWQALSRTDPTLALPDAIRDSVRERLQRLPQAERDALDWMAVYGRRLEFSTLQSISNQPQMTLMNTVEQLEARQLLDETTGRYDFTHPKIREVVYHDLSAARRRIYHRKIAEIMDALTPSPDKTSLLAHHFERGGEKEKALRFWMQAGQYALDTYAHQHAARHYERALALTEESAAQIDAYMGLGSAFILLDDYKAATVVIQQGISLAEQQGDDARRVRLLYARAQNASRQHRSDGGKPEVEAALTAAEQMGDEYYLAQSLLLLTEVHESAGDLSSALETTTRAQIISSKLDDDHLQARALVEIGFLRTQRAEFDEAVNAAKRGLELLKETDDRNAIAYAWNILGRALGGRGDYHLAIEAFHHSQEEAQNIGDRLLQAQALNMFGWLYRELGDYENGLKFDEQGIDYSKRWSKPSPEISARLNVCLDLLQLGDPEGAVGLLGDIEKKIHSGSFGFHSWRWRLRLLHARGSCYLACDEPTKALKLAEEGLPLAETNFTRKYVALNHELKGMALEKLGRLSEAIEATRKAISLADNIQYPPTRWAGRYLLADLLRQKDCVQEAEVISSEAAHIVQTIAESLTDESLRATFLNSALPK